MSISARRGDFMINIGFFNATFSKIFRVHMRQYPVLIFLFGASLTFQSCASNALRKEREQKFDIFKSKRAEKAYIKSYNKTLQDWPVPYEEVYVKTSLGKSHVVISGPKDAPPLVLLHGLNASSTMWYPNIKDFSKQYRTYAIDFILEPGKSEPEKGNFKKEEILNWYLELFDHFNFKKVSIVGASRGGWLAMALTLSSQNKIDRIVLLSPAQTLTSIKLKKKVFTNITFTFFPDRDRLRSVLETLSTNVDQLHQSYINQFYIASKHAKVNKSLFQMMPFSDDELKSLKIPVMILIGDHDIINNEKGLERAHIMPHVETGVIKNTGHFLSFDSPELIDKKVMKFLANTNQ
jgi:pimeloyl-ACP methyl ester carboxylesterase